MTVSRNFTRLLRALDCFGDTPALCSVARRAGQPSTSAHGSCLSDHRSYSPCAGSATSACTIIRRLSGSHAVGRKADPLHVALQQSRPLCTVRGGAAGLLYSEGIAKAPERHTALHAHQQRRCAFGLPNLNGDTSKQYQERRLIGYSPKQLFDVVAAVEHYKEFVPWCQRSQIIQEKPPDFVEAELEVGFKLFVERYTSQVHLHRPNKVVSHVYDSTLFDHLDSTWEFKPGPTPSSTWLYFNVDFAFKSPLYRHIASVFFDEVVKHMMGAFEGRCKHLYGTSAFAKRPPAAQKMQTA